MTTRVDAGLFAAAQAGDPLALDRLLRELQPDIRRYARRQCHVGSAIEDVVQETLIVLYRRVGTVRDLRALAGWLGRVVGRLCMLPVLGLLRGVEQIEAWQDGAQMATRPQDELRLDLVRALESLPAPYREIVLLRDMEQMSIAEIAAALDITREAAKSRLHRARTLMREYLSDDAGPAGRP